MTYKEPTLILMEKVKVTRYTIGPGEIYTKVNVLGVDEIPRTRDNVAAIRARLMEKMAQSWRMAHAEELKLLSSHYKEVEFDCLLEHISSVKCSVLGETLTDLHSVPLGPPSGLKGLANEVVLIDTYARIHSLAQTTFKRRERSKVFLF
ncbi:hypothetical protein Tco_1326310 [Tanacetum coccineum]